MSKGTGMNPTPEEELYRDIFDMFDRDGSGLISSKEFGTVVRAIGYNPTDEEITAAVKVIDSNGSGQLDFNEFSTYVKEIKKKHQNDLTAIENAFKVFDKNKNGFIESSELKTILASCGETISDEQIDEMIALADTNKDGHIDYKEFVKYMCKPIK